MHFIININNKISLTHSLTQENLLLLFYAFRISISFIFSQFILLLLLNIFANLSIISKIRPTYFLLFNLISGF